MALGDVLTELDLGFINSIRGLAWDGEALWYADTDALHRLDINTSTLTRSIPMPAVASSGIAWDGGALWFIYSSQDNIWRISAADGAVLVTIPAIDFGMQGLEWDPVTESLWYA